MNSITHRHLRLNRRLAGLIRSKVGEPLSGVEVGVWRGHLSYGLLKAFPKLRLTMVDSYKDLPDRDLGRLTRGQNTTMDQAQREAEIVTRQYGERRRILLEDSVDAAKMCSPLLYDFVFIDACHKYEYVAADLRAWWPRLRRGGLACGHDYKERRWHGVIRAVDEFFRALSLPVQVSDVIEGIWFVVKP